MMCEGTVRLDRCCENGVRKKDTNAFTVDGGRAGTDVYLTAEGV